jgi:hypothetical protein
VFGSHCGARDSNARDSHASSGFRTATCHDLLRCCVSLCACVLAFLAVPQKNLAGKNIYADCCGIVVKPSAESTLNVLYNNDTTHDFTRNLPAVDVSLGPIVTPYDPVRVRGACFVVSCKTVRTHVPDDQRFSRLCLCA